MFFKMYFYSKIPDNEDFYTYKYMSSIFNLHRDMEYFRNVEMNVNIHY